MKKLMVLIIALFLLVPLYSSAFEVISVDSVNVTIRYIEPTQNVDNSPLLDLSHTNPRYDIGAGPVLLPNVPASSPTGGATQDLTVTIPVSDGQEVDVVLDAVAVDASGNVSPPSNSSTIRIDRLAPGAPQ